MVTFDFNVLYTNYNFRNVTLKFETIHKIWRDYELKTPHLDGYILEQI